jgi:DNA-binding NarL/FixJ family response regulator
MKILLIDDHAATRETMSALIEAEEDMRVVAKAANGEEGVSQAEAIKPDLVVIDIIMPGINGIDATKAILANNPAARVLILSNHSGCILVQAALSAGVAGYVRKDRAFEELMPAIRAISAGRQYLGQGIND